jgi:DNA-binding response OmpR family regulator
LNKGKRILLVDDESDNNRIFTIALRDDGFTVDSFEDPPAALPAFKPIYYDLVILDIRMPKMRGDELYSQLRNLDDKFKVCILSAFGSEDYKTRFSPTTLANGIHYMRKPIALDEMVAKVNEIL